MNKKDLLFGAIIGAGVGLLIQPVLANSNALTPLVLRLGLSLTMLRALVFFFFLALAPTGIFIAQWVSKFIPVIYQIAKFAAVGTLNTSIDLGLFNLIGLLIGSPQGGTVKFAVMKSITFVFATTNSFFWNRLWTFGDKEASGTAGKAAKFFAITGMTWLLSVSVATGVSAIFPLNKVFVNVVAPLCGIFTAMSVNFLSYKFIVFKKTDTTPSAPSVPMV
ncbi:MAG: GtrA family protein [bacterium]|nr:GtrA family protein [bacterium]